MKRIFALVFSMFFVFGLYAQQGANKKADNRIPDLTQEQRDQLRNIRQKFNDDTRQLREEEYQLRQKYYELLREDNVNMNKVNDVVNQMANVRAKIDKRAAQMHVETMRILNQEQKKWYKENRLQVKGKPPVTPKPKVDKGNSGNKGNGSGKGGNKGGGKNR